MASAPRSRGLVVVERGLTQRSAGAAGAWKSRSVVFAEVTQQGWVFWVDCGTEAESASLEPLLERWEGVRCETGGAAVVAVVSILVEGAQTGWGRIGLQYDPTGEGNVKWCA